LTTADAPGAVQYPYKPKLDHGVKATIFGALFTLALVYIAVTNTRGVIISHLVTLDASKATWLYYLLTTGGIIWLVNGLNTLRLALMTTRCISLSPVGITIPAQWPGQANTTIPYRSISDLQIDIKSTDVVTIIHGQETTFEQSFFNDVASFHDCQRRLRDAIQAAH